VDIEEASTAPIGSITPWVNDDHSATGVIESVRINALFPLTEDFYISKYEITNEQYAAFLNAQGIEGEYDGENMRVGKYNGNILIYERYIYWDTEHTQWSIRNASDFGYSVDNLPVADVTWYGADEYARWAGGSLPTEAQWEYACRAGTTTPFGVGDGTSLYADQANFDGRYPYALPGGEIYNYPGNEHPNTYLNRTVPVGSYPPNAWGLYDMHGNVWEWCSDGSEVSRVLRGGGYNSEASYCRSAYRSYYSYSSSYYASYIGFRVVFPAE
jgi:formylglycine-generating enzyme required for sulfatase activity